MSLPPPHLLLAYSRLESGELGVLLREEADGSLHGLAFAATCGETLAAAAAAVFARAVASAGGFDGDSAAAEAHAAPKFGGARGVLALHDATGTRALFIAPIKLVLLTAPATRLRWVPLARVLEGALADGATATATATTTHVGPPDAPGRVSADLARALDDTEAAAPLRQLLLDAELRRAAAPTALAGGSGGGACGACVPRRVGFSHVFVGRPLALCDVALLDALGVRGVLCLARRHVLLAARAAAALGAALALGDARPPVEAAGADGRVLSLGGAALFGRHVEREHGAVLVVYDCDGPLPAPPAHAPPAPWQLPAAIAVVAMLTITAKAATAAAAATAADEHAQYVLSVADACLALGAVAPKCGAHDVAAWLIASPGAAAPGWWTCRAPAPAPAAPAASVANATSAVALATTDDASVGSAVTSTDAAPATTAPDAAPDAADGAADGAAAPPGGARPLSATATLNEVLREAQWLARAHAARRAAADAPVATPGGLGVLRVLSRPRDLLAAAAAGAAPPPRGAAAAEAARRPPSPVAASASVDDDAPAERAVTSATAAPERALALAAAPEPAAAAAAAAEGDSELVRFCCPRCRKPLFDSRALLLHSAEDAAEQQGGRHAFTGAGKGGGRARAAATCTSLFLDADVVGPDLAGGGVALVEAEGKLHCSCGARVGSLAWAGSQCACGTWVVPAIQVVRSKVDARRSVAAAAAAIAARAAVPSRLLPAVR
jgi:hypothetical protein